MSTTDKEWANKSRCITCENSAAPLGLVEIKGKTIHIHGSEDWLPPAPDNIAFLKNHFPLLLMGK